jgi:hypothetical protein
MANLTSQHIESIDAFHTRLDDVAIGLALVLIAVVSLIVGELLSRLIKWWMRRNCK